MALNTHFVWFAFIVAPSRWTILRHQFASAKPPFSQWHTGYPLIIDSRDYRCVEEYVTVQLFGDHAAAKAIMQTDSPREHKGKNVANFKIKVWYFLWKRLIIKYNCACGHCGHALSSIISIESDIIPEIVSVYLC